MRRLVPSLLASLLLASLASAAGADSTTTSVSTPTTIARKAVYVAPLTGLPDPTRVTRRRSALTIKIDNTPEAHPQSGIQLADIVTEEIVEGGITRLAATFNSRLPTLVGPIRSVRRTDREVVSSLGGIFVCSGGAAYALASIARAPVHFIDESLAGGAMFRLSTRYPPHNLYANAFKLMAFGGKPIPPKPQFRYVKTSAPALGRPIRSFTVGFSAGFATSYSWDARTRSWDRSIFGRPDVVASGQRVSPTNVIVMNVTYMGGAGVEGSEAKLTGTGKVEVFSAGHLQRGTWRRSNIYRPMVLIGTNGRVISLRPGQTWIELLDPYESTTIVPGR
ncbi:MAG TPA: DUF3048 domain-containing protein [Acidimicrobiales bacterium]|nr:DUF3048 domain-containing protein [Acidimicrobiales bacterium]